MFASCIWYSVVSNIKIICRKAITNTLSALTPTVSELGTMNGEECSIGSAGSLTRKKNGGNFDDDLSCK